GTRREVEDFFADPEPTDDGIARVVALVTEYDGLAYARERALEYGACAEEALAPLPPGQATEALHDAIAYVIDRRR
ncbi:MAG: hypothetical protein GWO02_08485, partial [Gammaproteobacteria bacterium]|nr:hypothetical protein [Gammaproteobacteria bacterium]